MKTEIKIESHESIVIRLRRSQTLLVFCEECRKEILHLSVSRVAAVLQFSEYAVFRLIESGDFHSTENRAGSLFVCTDSISKIKNNFIEG